MLFSRTDVEEALQLLATELVRANISVNINVVGSAAVMFLINREGLTIDIDVYHSKVDQVTQIVKNIALERNWPEDWCNDGVKMFVSHYDTPSDWELRVAVGGVQIFTAQQELMLAMKLLSGRGQRDQRDIEQLLQVCNIHSVSAAQRLFDHYYPTEVIAPKALAYLTDTFTS